MPPIEIILNEQQFAGVLIVGTLLFFILGWGMFAWAK